MTLTAPATATGSTLVTVDRHRAGDWQQALADLGRRLPVGWDASGERLGGVAGYDLILAMLDPSRRRLETTWPAGLDPGRAGVKKRTPDDLE